MNEQELKLFQVTKEVGHVEPHEIELVYAGGPLNGRLAILEWRRHKKQLLLGLIEHKKSKGSAKYKVISHNNF